MSFALIIHRNISKTVKLICLAVVYMYAISMFEELLIDTLDKIGN
jgi:hypothetical protein